MPDTRSSPAAAPRRVILFGASGTAGRAAATALAEAGHDVTCFLRPHGQHAVPAPADVRVRTGDVTRPADLRDTAFAGAPFDTVVSCIASRSGVPADAWAIDHRAQSAILQAAIASGVRQFVLLSAICVQRPKLAFQKAKLTFEAELMAAPVTWSIVRPTAFFKSLSGQIGRLRAGKPFLLFGDGTLTACKPISDADLGRFIASCLTDPARQNRTLPIGGPGPALTPLEQGAMLFDLMGRSPRYRHVPVGMMDGIIAALSVAGRLSPRLAAKAELARIGRYYATESMLLWDAEAGRYDAAETPEFGTDTLEDHYRRIIESGAEIDLGDHAMF